MSEIDRRWIVACLIGALANAVAGFVDYAARDWLEAGGAETASTITAIYAAVSAVLNAGSAAVYAWFTGAVLRLIAPALPWRSWIAVHLAIGAMAGIGFALIYTAPTGEPGDWSDVDVIGGTLLVALLVAACALLGAVIGALQALVLRRAAHGMRRWIAVSALSVVVLGLLLIPAALLYPADGTFVREAADQGVLFIATVVAAFVMLPALRRLRPRTV